MLLTVDLLTFWFLAIKRQLHCVIPFGLARRVALTMASIFSGPKGGLASPARRHIPQALDTLLRKAPSPQHDCLSIDLQLSSDGAVGSTGGRGQHDPAAQGHLLGSSV